jgi:hypothetical protein
LLAIMVVAGMSAPADAQTRPASSGTGAAFTPPKTAWGDPDLEGLWRGIYRTNFERPIGEAREFYTDAEVKEKEDRAERLNELRLQGKQENRGFRNQANYNSVVGYSPEKARYNKRTSQIIDPPDGRLPMWTLDAIKYYEHREAITLGRGDADWTVDRPTGERCFPLIAFPIQDNFGMALRGKPGSFGFVATEGTIDGGASGGGSGTSADGPYRIVQGPGYVVILEEEQGLGGGIAGSRVIPISDKPRPTKFHQWMGVSRARWEGNTLVIVTTNLQYPGPVITSYGPTYPGTGKRMTFTERYTRTGPDTLEFKYTVEDPDVYVRPYTVMNELWNDKTYKISNVLCHEGHDDMPSALAAGRFDEVTALDNANDTRLAREPRFKELKEAATKYAEGMKNTR